MQLKIPGRGNLNYVETPLELAWADVTAASGMRLQEPEAGDGIKGEDGPIFARCATRKENLITEYNRWFDSDFRDKYALGNPESSQDAAIEYFAKHVDDAEHTYEVVEFHRPSVMGFNLFFYGGVLGTVDDGYLHGDDSISLPELLQRNGITGLEGKDDLALLQAAITKHNMDYASVFRLFMNPEATIRRRKGEQDATSA